MVDFRQIQQKWKRKWAEEKVFEADAHSKKKKFFGTFPYPYMNGFLHMGHFYSIMRLEVFSRYKRMQGFNVLFPQGWHCTGSPIEAAAKRVREYEPKQIESMKKQGFSDDEIKKFSDPKYWTEFFPKEAKKDFTDLGLSIDFRRSFITTDLNPHYNKFIEWQFRKLKEKNYIIKGNHPVVWDPKENTPVGDHDRIEGEGEIPQEFVLVKHQLDDDRFVVSATLRPDTILGMTNLYVHPKFEYLEISINDETWILGKHAVERLKEQGRDITIRRTIKGTELIGKKTKELDGDTILILPATFLDEKFGTGLVHSCLSDSPDDLIALQDLQKDEAMMKRYNLNVEEVRAIKPKPVLVTGELGEIPAQVMLDKYKVKSQNEKDKLENIKKEIYKISFHTAVFNKKYKSFFKRDLEGVKVSEGKEYVKSELLKTKWADHYYQLTGKVVSRSLAECVVKVVDDQWFMNYSDTEWKKLAHECLDQMRLYPEKSRQQFNYVLDWLQNWACVREIGLGTKLPWDNKWVIESLSDSTIYMAYYTIAHLIEQEDADVINDSVFDHIFFDGPKPKNAIKNIEKMKNEFEYWYPMDFRNSGKDLIQNHLAFSIFNHVAIFPRKMWPKSFSVNGWVTVDGQKMSKSLGNFIMLKDLVVQYPVDGSRITIMSGGEGLDDPNWDSTFAETMHGKLEQLYSFCTEHYGKGTDKKTTADKWMESQLHLMIKETTQCMESTLFRSALQKSFFELPRIMRSYAAKTGNQYNKDIMDSAVEASVLMLAPFAPFISEELWHHFGKKGFIANASWPEFDEKKIDLKAIYLDDAIASMKKDVMAIQKLANLDALSKIMIIVAPEWKYQLIATIKGQLEETRDVREILKTVLASNLKKHEKDVVSIVPKLVNNPALLPQVLLSKTDEMHAIKEAIALLEKEFKCTVELMEAEKSHEKKASQALPGKPAIVVS